MSSIAVAPPRDQIWSRSLSGCAADAALQAASSSGSRGPAQAASRGFAPEDVAPPLACQRLLSSFASWSLAVAAAVSYSESQSTSFPLRSMTVFSLNCRSPLLTLSMKLTNWEFANFGLPLFLSISTIWAACPRSASSAAWLSFCASAKAASISAFWLTCTGTWLELAGAMGPMLMPMPPTPMPPMGPRIMPGLMPMPPMRPPMGMPPIMPPMGMPPFIMGPCMPFMAWGPAWPGDWPDIRKAASRTWAPEDEAPPTIGPGPWNCCAHSAPGGGCIIMGPLGPCGRTANSPAQSGPPCMPIGPSVKKPASLPIGSAPRPSMCRMS
mmetsp:Transcript_26946/g.71157  ORF Transcript_26946/g.71157 Transcript_26946/m.71157 type:complete len:325 (+) Transcript_26946:1187-2161(+)